MVEENIRQQILKFEKHKSDKPVLDHNAQCVVNFLSLWVENITALDVFCNFLTINIYWMLP